jgi:cell filamentation protein
MSPADKYEADDPAFDPKLGLLRNRLGITDASELERRQSAALILAYDRAALSYSETHRFTANDVRDLHRLFLGEIFAWAGDYRKVDISSDEIRWCHAAHIEASMERYGQRLAELTPFSPSLSRGELLANLAELHGELIVIHPFRDGNGRTTRMFCNLLLMQAERPPIRFGAFDDHEIRREYHAAIRELWAKVEYGRLIALLDRLVL